MQYIYITHTFYIYIYIICYILDEGTRAHAPTPIIISVVDSDMAVIFDSSWDTFKWSEWFGVAEVWPFRRDHFHQDHVPQERAVKWWWIGNIGIGLWALGLPWFTTWINGDTVYWKNKMQPKSRPLLWNKLFEQSCTFFPSYRTSAL